MKEVNKIFTLSLERSTEKLLKYTDLQSFEYFWLRFILVQTRQIDQIDVILWKLAQAKLKYNL